MENTIKNNRDDAVLTEQFAFMERVREILCSRYKSPPKAFVHTYGCQGNVSDGERLKGMLEQMKDIEIVEPMVTIRSRMKSADIASFESLADAILG